MYELEDLEWDAAADSFDEEADRGLRDPQVKAAWVARLGSWIPSPTGDVLDLGCGTGSLTLLAQHGHRVVGVDLSPNMVESARRKIAAAALDARVVVGDAEDDGRERRPPGAVAEGQRLPAGLNAPGVGASGPGYAECDRSTTTGGARRHGAA